MSPSPTVIIQITDLHILAKPEDTMSGVNTENTFKQVLRYVKKNHNHVDLILVTGDLTQDPYLSSYQRIYKELTTNQTRSICLPGNHDDFSMMRQVFNHQQVNCDKHIQFKDWQIICLNSQVNGSHGGRINNDEQQFLIEVLEKHAELHTMIAVHHHPLPTDSAWMDTMIIENNDELFSLLSHYSHIKAIICGHIHQTLEKKQQGISVLGTPSTCFQFKPLCNDYALDEKGPGYRIIELYPDGRINSNTFHIPHYTLDTNHDLS